MRLRFDPEPDVCPTAAFEPDELAWPRIVRRAFSDPRVPHESTGVHGRGTEEVKTNDVSGRVKVGEVGFTIEFGRPGVGVWFREIQKMCCALAKAGVAFEKKNPVTSLMSDVATGTIREDILDEKVLSAIVEIKVPVERTEEIIRLVWDVEKQIDTVVALGVGARCDRGWRGEQSSRRFSNGSGYKLERAKTNIGLGRITNPARSSRAGSSRCAMTNTLHRFGPRRKLPRRLHRLRHVQPRQERSGRVAQAEAISGNGAAVQAGQSGRRDSRRRVAAVEAT